MLYMLPTGSIVYAQPVPINSDITKQTFVYAKKDTVTLDLDVYSKHDFMSIGKHPCVMFVFGGAFIGGQRNDTIYNRYFNSLTEHGIVVVPISYRLGLKGAQHLSIMNTKPLVDAIDMAVDDVYDATNWLLQNADELNIDPSKIILSGSSSGAITVLQSDYYKRNQNAQAGKLPPLFEYAGVIAFSGAVFSLDWGLEYKTAPAPMMLFHGTADKIVPYEKIGFLNKGLFGSAWIAKIATKNSYPFYFESEVDLGHEVSVIPMYTKLPDILNFIDTFIMQKKPYQMQISFKDPDIKPMLTISATELFKKLQQKGN